MRTRLEADQRSQNLIHEGLRVFSKHGFHDLSASDIAEACGVSKALLFHYFSNKEGFYIEVLSAASQALIDLTKKSESLSGIKRVEAVISDYLDWVEDQPRIYEMLFNSDLGWHRKVRKIHDQKRNHYRDVVFKELFPGQIPTQKQSYDFIGASSYVEGAVLHWLKTQDVSKSVLQTILMDGIRRIILVS